MADTGEFTIWFPHQSWPRIADRVAALNTADGPLGLPSVRLPVSLEFDDQDPCYRDEVAWRADEIVGSTIDGSVFARPGWSVETLASYLANRPEHLAPSEEDPVRVSVATLAAWLDVPLVVDDRAAAQIIHFVTAAGAVVTCALGTDADPTELRRRFFAEGRIDAVSPPELVEDGADLLRARARAVREDLEHLGRGLSRGALVAPYGATIGPQDLALVDPEAVDPSRPVLASVTLPDGRQVCLIVGSDPRDHGICCEIDGVAQTHTDPFTGLESMTATAFEWIDWILELSVPAPADATGPWTGNDVSAVLTRAEHNIVAFDSREIATSRFATGRDLQDWISEALAATTIRPEVAVLDDIAYGLAHPETVMARRFERRGDEPEERPVRYHPVGFHPWLGVDRWFRLFTHANRAAPSVIGRTDGPVVETFLAEYCLAPEMVEDYLRLAATPIDRHSWVMLRIPGVTGIMAFPIGGTMLEVGWDADGAEFHLVARHRDSRITHLERRRTFRRRWGRWLDPGVRLTADELRLGLETVASLADKEN